MGNSTDQDGDYGAELYSHNPDDVNRTNSNYDHDAYGHTRATNLSASSGKLRLRTADAFPNLNRAISSGVSSPVDLGTGASGYGDSGGVSISTGDAVRGVGGDIVLSVGNGTDAAGFGDGSGKDGGKISVTAGLSTSDGQSGGAIELSAGTGVSSTNSVTRGGDIKLKAGNAVVAAEESLLASGQPWNPYTPLSKSTDFHYLIQRSASAAPDGGGSIAIDAGNSLRGNGGDLLFHC